MKKVINTIKQKKGFTLIELIVIIAVIGILVLLAAPKFLGYTKDAKLAHIQNDVKAYEDAIVAEMISGEQEKIDEWGWDSVSTETVKDYMSEDLLFNKKGKVSSFDEDEFYLVNNKDISVNSKLKGDFIYAKDGKVYYYERGMGGGGSSEPEEIPEGFTLLTDDDFEFVEESSAPNEYKLEDEVVRGYFHYKGNYDKVVIPHEIMENEIEDYYEMFSNNGVVVAVISDNKNITNSSKMFEDSEMTSLDLNGFDTSNVTDMSEMFAGSQMAELDLSNFDTSKVTDMSEMFAYSDAISLDLSNFDTSQVTDMYGMFQNSRATSIDLSSFNTSKVTDMGSMFRGSYAASLDFSSFDTSSVESMSSMFSISRALELDLSEFNTSSVTSMDRMFMSSSAIELDLNSFNTSSVTDMSQMFANSRANILDLSSFDTDDVSNMIDMFRSSKAIEGYARTKDDVNRFNGTSNKPSNLNFTTK